MKLFSNLIMQEKYAVILLIAYLSLSIYLFKIDQIIFNLVLLCAVFIMSFFIKKINNDLINYYYLGVFTFALYAQVQVLVDGFHNNVYDQTIISFESSIGVLGLYASLRELSFPILTEYLQIVYFLFYIIPLFYGIELFKNKKIDELKVHSRNIFFAFYFSYLLYLILPAVGPRFFLFDYNLLNQELPGLYLTEQLRMIIDLGGGIIANDNVNVLSINKDCMPSGHTMITIITLYYTFLNRSKFKYIYLVYTFSLIFATLYLNYHYLVDILAGVFFGVLSLIIEPRVNKLLDIKNHK